jgi:hypothetical protein
VLHPAFLRSLRMLTIHKHDDADRDASACKEQSDQRTPSTPSHIPLYGWWGVLRRSAWRMSEDRLFGEAAAVAFYSLLAVLPALVALTALFSLIVDSQVVAERLRILTAPLPAGGAERFCCSFSERSRQGRSRAWRGGIRRAR